MAAIEVRVRVSTDEGRAFGPGRADLLEQIAAKGSISAAAKAMDMSYSRAWQLVDSMNTSFKRPLVAAATGGKKGGGARLTKQGEEVLALYRTMQAQLESGLTTFFPEFQKRLK